MAASILIEEERGTFITAPHRHNGYYAGDFSVYPADRPVPPLCRPRRRPSAGTAPEPLATRSSVSQKEGMIRHDRDGSHQRLQLASLATGPARGGLTTPVLPFGRSWSPGLPPRCPWRLSPGCSPRGLQGRPVAARARQPEHRPSWCRLWLLTVPLVAAVAVAEMLPKLPMPVGRSRPRKSSSSPRAVLKTIITTVRANQAQLPEKNSWPEDDSRNSSMSRARGVNPPWMGNPRGYVLGGAREVTRERRRGWRPVS